MEKRPLPNATAVLILGMLSFILSPVIVGLLLGIIGLSLSGRGRRMYKQNKTFYDGYGTLKVGRFLCILGVILGILATTYFVIIGSTLWSMYGN